MREHQPRRGWAGWKPKTKTKKQSMGCQKTQSTNTLTAQLKSNLPFSLNDFANARTYLCGHRGPACCCSRGWLCARLPLLLLCSSFILSPSLRRRLSMLYVIQFNWGGWQGIFHVHRVFIKTTRAKRLVVEEQFVVDPESLPGLVRILKHTRNTEPKILVLDHMEILFFY